jgi:hypothetical protein
VLDDLCAEFGGTTPLKPVFRQELNDAKQNLLTCRSTSDGCRLT